MKVSNTTVCHIRFDDMEEHLIAVVGEIIDNVRNTMRDKGCDLMYNTQTGECVTLDEFDRLAGIFSGLAEMDEIMKE